MRTVRRLIALGLTVSLSSGCATLLHRSPKEAILAVSAEDAGAVRDDQIDVRITARESQQSLTRTGTYITVPLEPWESYDVQATAPGHRPSRLTIESVSNPLWVLIEIATLAVGPMAITGLGMAIGSLFGRSDVGTLVGAIASYPISIAMVVVDSVNGSVREHHPNTLSLTLPADRYSGRFEVELADVRRTMVGSDGKAVHLPQSLDQAQGKQLLFQDPRIRLQWTLRPNGLGVALENRTDRSIKVFWDDAAYVDTTGLSHRLIRDGAGLSDKDHPQVPSVVPANARLADLLVPAEAYEQREGAHDVLLPDLAEGVKGAVDEAAAPLIGKEMTVVLPMQVQGVISDYTFRFRIKGVAVQPVTEPPSTWGDDNRSLSKP